MAVLGTETELECLTHPESVPCRPEIACLKEGHIQNLDRLLKITR